MQLQEQQLYLAYSEKEGGFVVRYLGPEPGSPKLIKVEIIDQLNSTIQHEEGYTTNLVAEQFKFTPWENNPHVVA